MARRKKLRTRVIKSRAVVPGLSSDWYWEQDAELRFTRVQVRSGDPVEQQLAERIIGKRRWETGIEIEGTWDEHRAVLQARAPFRDVLMWRELEDGGRRYVLTSGEPVFDAKGSFTGYRGVGRDVTAQKRVERLLRLEHRITRRLSEHAPPQEALGRALQTLCETESWDCGELWKLDEGAGVLRRYAHWFNPQLEGARRFVEDSRDMSFSRGAGLVGAVWQSGEPLWVADSRSDPRAMRTGLAARTGLYAAVLFPIWTGGRVGAVLDVTSRRMRAPHKRLHQALHVIASMIGQFLERTAAEQAVRESEARFRSLTHLSSDWYWEQDAEYRFTRLEGRQVTGGDQSLRARLFGQQRWESGLEIEGGWEAHRAILEARAAFHDLLMWRELGDGSLRYMKVSGEPIFGANGEFAGYRGVGREVTAEKRAELLLRLEHRVAGVLAAAEFSTSGLIEVIRAVCEAEHWVCGRYFQLDEDARQLRFHDAWCIPEPGFRQFVERSRTLSYARGEGLLGKCRKAAPLACSASPARSRASPTSAWWKPRASSAARSASSWSASAPRNRCARASSASARSPRCPRTSSGKPTRRTALHNWCMAPTIPMPTWAAPCSAKPGGRSRPRVPTKRAGRRCAVRSSGASRSAISSSRAASKMARCAPSR